MSHFCNSDLVISFLSFDIDLADSALFFLVLALVVVADVVHCLDVFVVLFALRSW